MTPPIPPVPPANRTVCEPEFPAGGGAEIDRNLLVQYFSEAFCFSDGQAYPIFGWRPDGTGELSDAAIDELLAKRIQRTRSEWESAA